MRSMIKFCTERKTNTDISLLYSNRNEDEIPFYDDLMQMQRANPQLLVGYNLFIFSLTPSSPLSGN